MKHSRFPRPRCYGRVYPKRTETDLQKDILIWARTQYPGILTMIAPNNLEWIGGVSKFQRMKIVNNLRKMGFTDGTHDLTILEPRGAFHGMTIEFKMPGGVVSSEQESFRRDAEHRGYFSCVPDRKLESEQEAFDWAISKIKFYMNLPPAKVAGSDHKP